MLKQKFSPGVVDNELMPILCPLQDIHGKRFAFSDGTEYRRSFIFHCSTKANLFIRFDGECVFSAHELVVRKSESPYIFSARVKDLDDDWASQFEDLDHDWASEFGWIKPGMTVTFRCDEWNQMKQIRDSFEFHGVHYPQEEFNAVAVAEPDDVCAFALIRRELIRSEFSASELVQFVKSLNAKMDEALNNGRNYEDLNEVFQGAFEI